MHIFCAYTGHQEVEVYLWRRFTRLQPLCPHRKSSLYVLLSPQSISGFAPELMSALVVALFPPMIIYPSKSADGWTRPRIHDSQRLLFTVANASYAYSTKPESSALRIARPLRFGSTAYRRARNAGAAPFCLSVLHFCFY